MAAANTLAWLQVLAWGGTLVAAIIAGIALRQNALQGRARLLMDVYKIWEGSAETRHNMFVLMGTVQKQMQDQSDAKLPAQGIELQRRLYHDELFRLRATDASKWSEYVNYVAFFEILGVYVRNGYLPLRDVMQVFKGPILLVDVAWRDVIQSWQREPGLAPGLLEHALFLMEITRQRHEHPLYYWATWYYTRKVISSALARWASAAKSVRKRSS
jgi:hypothetical protein